MTDAIVDDKRHYELSFAIQKGGLERNESALHVHHAKQAKADDADATHSATRTHEIEWYSTPTRRNRRQGTVESEMPTIMRDLQPGNVFDPCVTWEKLKEKSAAAAAAVAKAQPAAEAKASGGKKPKKPKKLSKKEEMQLQNTQRLHAKDVDGDMERLHNSDRGVILTHKMKTPEGRMYQILEVMGDAVESRQKPVVFDALWALEQLPLYQEMTTATATATAESKDGDKKKKKEKKEKKEKKGKGKDKDKGKGKDKGEEVAGLPKKYSRTVRKGREYRGRENILLYQLRDMADRLPPLSRFVDGWQLDPWQQDVLTIIDQGESAVVCAPTSSGKTVLSTYATVAKKISDGEGESKAGGGGGAGGDGDGDEAGRRILFVVPSEPLVWQVGAMFHKMLRGKTALVTTQFSYTPDHTGTRVVVGTPRALESALSKVRGLVGAEKFAVFDYAQVAGGFNRKEGPVSEEDAFLACFNSGFDYVVYDEVHSLDGPEGAALQRLIRLVSCPFLALSATIGNADELREWWETVRVEQVLHNRGVLDATSDEARSLLAANEREWRVNLVNHDARFINLQRYVWDVNSSELKMLHPCSAVNPETLRTSGLEGTSVPFTPADSLVLWEKLQEFFPSERVADLDPNSYFPREFPDAPRMTLDQTRQYEAALKSRLSELAPQHPDAADRLLAQFVPAHAVSSDYDMLTLVQQLKESHLTPAIMFQLDSYKCLELFKNLLQSIETAQREKYPNYLEELQQQLQEQQALRAQAEGRAKHINAKEEEEEAKDGEDISQEFIDTSQPHPEFVLTPPTSRMSNREYAKVKEEICGRGKKDGDWLQEGHALLRALRRGFAVYIEDGSFPTYHRVVQRLAQEGKLALVFSDYSLAYGVNMPFRTCCFCGDTPDLLDPLNAQQMAGRAGRRGLDFQGNLVYVGMDWQRIQEVMIGQIPAIEGKNPLYPTIALHEALTPFVNVETLERMCGTTFSKFRAAAAAARGEDRGAGGDEEEADYLDMTKEVCQQLGFTDELNELKKDWPFLAMIWELREYVPESLVIAFTFDDMMQTFVLREQILGTNANLLKNQTLEKVDRHHKNEGIQLEFLAIMCQICDRAPCPEGSTPLHEAAYFAKKNALWGDWQARIAASQDRLAGLPCEDQLRLSVGVDVDLDGGVFEVLRERNFPTDMSSRRKHDLVQRLWRLGNILKQIGNCCQQGELVESVELNRPYMLLGPLVRRCFGFVKYLLSDLAKKESVAVDATVVSQFASDEHGEADEDEDDDDEAEEPATVFDLDSKAP